MKKTLISMCLGVVCGTIALSSFAADAYVQSGTKGNVTFINLTTKDHKCKFERRTLVYQVTQGANLLKSEKTREFFKKLSFKYNSSPGAASVSFQACLPENVGPNGHCTATTHNCKFPAMDKGIVTNDPTDPSFPIQITCH
jgi:hypothetical protein